MSKPQKTIDYATAQTHPDGLDVEFLTCIYRAMVVVSGCDGSIHKAEKEVLADYIATFKLENICKLPRVGPVKPREQQNIDALIADVADRCDSDARRYFLLERLSQISDADSHMHNAEAHALGILHRKWDTEISLTKHVTTWTPSQKRIIDGKPDQRVLVEAPPGAGKTALIAARIQELVGTYSIQPSNIWLISFTRTAVREMRDRISLMSSEYPQGLRVATLDSSAFAMNVGLGIPHENLFDGYEYSIDKFVEHLKDENDDVLDFLDGLEHVVIDEAQDLIGNRQELCFELIDRLPKECGVTVLGDEFQQIYGNWSQKGSDPVVSLQQKIRRDRTKKDFERVELTEIHRTSSPELLSLIEDLRLDMTVYDESAEDDLARRRQMLKDRVSGVSREELSTKVSDNCLILFRTTAEVLGAAIRLMLANRQFRLRIPRYPRYLSSWINSLFQRAQREELDQLDQEQLETFLSGFLARDLRFLDRNHIWNHLMEAAGEKGHVSMTRLRERLAKHQKNAVAFQNPEFGFSGPIVGTVHSSKGRESEHVFFSLPKKRTGRASKNMDHGEESRVLFVGASRAQTSLQLVDSGLDVLSQGWEYAEGQKRFFKHYAQPGVRKTPMSMLEIGLDGDYDPFSIVSREFGDTAVDESQEFLATYWPVYGNVECYAKWHPKGLTYFIMAIAAGRELSLGRFSDRLHVGLIKGSQSVFGWRYFPPTRLDNLRIVDVATYVAARDDERLDNCVARYAERGSWLYPVLFGFGPVRYRLSE